jgi:outer membrane protein assembly factor BamB
VANWHGFLSGAAHRLRRGRMAMAVFGAAIAGTAAPAPDARPRQVRGPRLLWQVAGEGRGIPALDVSTAYFLSIRHEVVAVHRRTGAVRWRHSTGEPGQTTAGSAVSVVDDLVIAGDYNVLAFERADGTIRWRFVPSEGYGPGLYLGAATSGRVFAGSPAARLYAIDVASGRLQWSASVSAEPETTVYAPVADDAGVVAAYIVSFEPASGRQQWHASFPARTGPASRPAGGPLLVGGWVVAASGDGAIHGFDRRDGALVWSIPSVHEGSGGVWDVTAQDFRALARVGPTLFAGSLTGMISAYRVATRAERWRRAAVDASTSFGIGADAELVYVPHFSGELVAVDARDGRERWRLGRTPGFRWPPAIDGNRLYLAGSAGGFFAFLR